MKPTLTLTAALICLSAPAMADPIGPEPLKMLITGNTLYVTMPKGAPGAPDGGIAPIYFGQDGSAAAKLPAGMTLVGTWALAEQGYCVDWDNGPKNSCSSISRGPEAFTITDTASGQPRGEVSTIATGNAEQL